MFAAILFWLRRGSSRWQEDWVSLLADILGVALAGAVAFTIFSEVLGKMVLLIPKAVRKIRAVGEAEGRESQRARTEEAYRKFGIDVDGVRSLPDTQEVRDFLAGKGEEQP